MEDKFQKRKNCLYCEKEMEAKYRNKKFCSDKCRIYYKRENPKGYPEIITPTEDVKELSNKEPIIGEEVLIGENEIEYKDVIEESKMTMRERIEFEKAKLNNKK